MGHREERSWDGWWELWVGAPSPAPSLGTAGLKQLLGIPCIS